ncbi:MAG TPA: rRNA maturation RNase YbeY [Vicinamibacterales bacterium]|nr:rRNA maturation RNase YbeY [Vicinamibacterales bacterium]
MTSASRASQRLRVDVSDARGRRLSGPDVSGLGAWLSRAAPRGARGRLTIALVTDAVMRRLNRQYRSADKATDVLSFPADASPAPPNATGLPAVALAKAGFLGDLAIARGVAARQARAQGHSMRVEIRVLALHGLLHLLGYDHEVDAGEMARLEERLRRRAGVPSGLIGRPARRHPPHA